MKRVNRTLVLNLVKSGGPISRSRVAELSGLSPATVSNLTGELLAEGLIHEVGSGHAVRGRPPVLLEVNTKAGFVVGVKLMAESAAAVVTDLAADVLHHDTIGFPGVGADLEAIVEAVGVLVDSSVEASGVDRSQLLGVGVGLAGLIDGDAGVCHYSPVFGWRDVDLIRPLRRRLGFDVFVENDVNALTIAEQWFGHGQGRDDFVVMTVGAGVGLGVVANGRFYRGADGSAGELGHIIVVPDGPICGCGKRGCLEAVASDGAVVDWTRRAIENGRATSLEESDLAIERIAAAAADGDGLAAEAFEVAGRWLGIGAATVVNLINPELIIVAGEGVTADAGRLAAMRSALNEYAFDDLASRVEIAIEPAGDETWARGAACVVLGELFKSPLHERHGTPTIELRSQVATS